MPLASHVPDETFVQAIAGLKHPECTVQSVYRKKVLTLGANYEVFDDPALPEPTPLHVSTLQAVVDYMKAAIADDHKLVVNVVSPTKVQIVAPLAGPVTQQLTYLTAAPTLPDLHIGTGNYLGMEAFMIQLMSCFQNTPEREELQSFCSRVKSGLAREIEDDGVQQTVTVMAGATRAEGVKIKNPWQLAPFRTFPEVSQPSTDFILRMKQDNTGGDNLIARAALIEADGGAWRMQAIAVVGSWLREQLGNAVTILA